MSEIIVKGRRCVICNTAVGSVVIRCKDDPEYDLTYDGDWSKTSRVHFDTREAAEAFVKQHADQTAGERPEGLYAVVSGSEDPLPIVRLWRGNRWWDHRGIEVSIYQDWQPLETAHERELRKRVAELEKERDEWKSSAEFANETLGKVDAERDAAIEWYEFFKREVCDKNVIRIQEALGDAVPAPKEGYLLKGGIKQMIADIRALRERYDELRKPQEVVRGGGTLRPGVWVYGKNGVFDDAFAAFESEESISEYTYVRVGDIPAFPATPEPQYPAKPKWGKAVCKKTGEGVLWIRPHGMDATIAIIGKMPPCSINSKYWKDNYTIISEPEADNAE